ncbi:hypothetical protein NP493_316g01008 [Ridgeia piscesae]|uniref:Uncharacterized protein n=1 Tax=Ridgeia piscesae TaxID=27915 RepID=A0AAD9L4K1_RIDPI|nr:hypothetical protein NP493_316g01008 [Ridgeia piscesae]
MFSHVSTAKMSAVLSGYRNVFTTDSNGCRVCKCRSLCETVRCPPGRTCVLRQIYNMRRPMCVGQ